MALPTLGDNSGRDVSRVDGSLLLRLDSLHFPSAEFLDQATFNKSPFLVKAVLISDYRPSSTAQLTVARNHHGRTTVPKRKMYFSYSLNVVYKIKEIYLRENERKFSSFHCYL